MTAGRFDAEIIDADEIRTLEYVKERITNILERLGHCEITSKQAMAEINADPTVSRFVRIAICEIIRNEIMDNDLTTFVDEFGWFETRDRVGRLLTKVKEWVNKQIEHFIRTSTAKFAGGLIIP